MILDEGHAMKSNAQQTKAVLDLEAERRWVLTGNDMDFWDNIYYLTGFWDSIYFWKVNSKYMLLSKLWGNL